MRDNQAIYAAVTPSEVKAQWGCTAVLAASAVGATWLFHPDDWLVAAGLLLFAVIVGCVWAYAFPPQRRAEHDAPFVIVASLTGVGLLVAATVTGPFVCAIATTALTAFFATFTFNVSRHHRTHGIVEDA